MRDRSSRRGSGGAGYDASPAMKHSRLGATALKVAVRQKVFSLLKKREIGFWRDLGVSGGGLLGFWGSQSMQSEGRGPCVVTVKREAQRGWGELG